MPPNLPAFALFAVATSVTPGPNNIMVASSAASNGVRATIPQTLGISLGFGAMVVIVGLGLAGPLADHPGLHAALRWVGAAWIIWIAWHIARADSGALPDGRGRVTPMGFMAAALFQWVNPKAWIMAVATTATYASPEHGLAGQVLVFAALFAVLCVPCTLLWSLLGAGVGRVLRSPVELRAFNAVMAALLVLSVLPSLVR